MTRVAAAFVLCLPVFCSEIHGIVVSSVTGRPLSRAEVVLRSIPAGKMAVGVTTDESGRFAFLDVRAGQYALVTTRMGYIHSTASYQEQVRMTAPFPVDRDLKGVIIRLQPAATIAGRVRYSDGEAASGVVVQAYREVYERKRHRYESATRSITDDRGEYRLFGLPAGRYYIAAIYMGFDGQNDIAEQLIRDPYGQLVTPERTVTTFAPSTYKLTEANPVVVTPGMEAGTTDIFLARSRTCTVRGRVLSGTTGAAAEGPAVTLLREDASGTGYVPYPQPVRSLQRGEFEIRGVVPGVYVLEARTEIRGGVLYARQPLVVGNAPEVTANLLLQSEAAVTGTVLAASREETVPPGLKVVAEPRGGIGGTRTATFTGPSTFTLRLVPGETYDLLLESPKGDKFITNARLGDTDLLSQGLRVESRTNEIALLTITGKGSEIRGQTEPGANVLLLPREPILTRHSETMADEWGRFAFSAVAAGDYKVLAWYDEAPCDVWSPAAGSDCARFGEAVAVNGANSYTVAVRVR